MKDNKKILQDFEYSVEDLKDEGFHQHLKKLYENTFALNDLGYFDRQHLVRVSIKKFAMYEEYILKHKAQFEKNEFLQCLHTIHLLLPRVMEMENEIKNQDEFLETTSVAMKSTLTEKIQNQKVPIKNLSAFGDKLLPLFEKWLQDEIKEHVKREEKQ